MGPDFFVYIAGNVKRDDAKIRAFAEAVGLGLYDAKIMLGAPGPRKVGAFVKEQDAEAQALKLRLAGFIAFVVGKERFSRAPRILRALKAAETPEGLVFRIETELKADQTAAERVMEYPQPKGFVRAVVLGNYTQTTTRSEGTRSRHKEVASLRSHVQEPFLHLYSEDPHTILEIRSGGRFEMPWPQAIGPLVGDARWQKLAELMTAYYGAKLDTTIWKAPEEAETITAALNVSAALGQAGQGVATAASSSDNTPVAMCASRIIVYSLVFGV